MIPQIPDIRDYAISATHGFLPQEPPLKVLPDQYYQPWEHIITNLQTLLLTRQLHRAVDELETLSTDRLLTEPEWQRAYLVLGFLAHSYIWGGEKAKDRLPQCIAVPFLDVSGHLEIPPVATYAAVCLWNFHLVNPNLPTDDLENLETLTTFTGSIDESWFYLVSIAIEARGAPTIPLMLEAMAAARRDDSWTLTDCLTIFAERIDDLRDILGRMYENCTPANFYFRIRPFLAGSKNMKEAGLPNGILYEDGSGTEEYRQYSGGSNAQSSLIQAFDIILGVEHRPTGVKRDPSKDKEEGTAPPPKHNFIEEMRKYMPGPHRRFLEHLALVANIRDYVGSHRDDTALSHAYDDCLKALASFRDKHLQVVSRYIVIQSQEAKRKASIQAATSLFSEQVKVSAPNNNVEDMTPAGLAKAEPGKQGLKGTGGTKLMPFLKQSRDETIEPVTTGWTRLIKADNGPIREAQAFLAPLTASDFVRSCKVNEFDDFTPIVGLAGAWEANDDVGGLCQY
ncbi:Indoleamine 2,3-dioxygenase [Rhizina undulata]